MTPDELMPGDKFRFLRVRVDDGALDAPHFTAVMFDGKLMFKTPTGRPMRFDQYDLVVRLPSP